MKTSGRLTVLALAVVLGPILGACTAQTAKTGGPVGTKTATAEDPATPKISLSASLAKDRQARDPLSPAQRSLDLTPDGLKGFGPQTLIRLLGEPAAVRAEPPAEVWQYKTETCILDLFLYNEAAEPKVSYVTARPTGLIKTSPQDCLDKVRTMASVS